jgi:hypothetical protein
MGQAPLLLDRCCNLQLKGGLVSKHAMKFECCVEAHQRYERTVLLLSRHAAGPSTGLCRDMGHTP